MAKIHFKDVSKSFGSFHILKNLNLSIEEQKNTVIIGGSGTGKSVLLKCLLGLLKNDTGSIFINNQDMCSLSDKKRSLINNKIGVVFQNGALFDSMSVFDNITFGIIATQKSSEKNALEIAETYLNKVGLQADVGYKFPSELSGGMKKRVSIARAIAIKPEIILFDEPTTGLDPITATTINSLINSTVKNVGATAITITHDLQSIQQIADKVAFLYNGQILWEGDLQSFNSTQDPYIRQIITANSDGPITWAKIK